MKKFILKKEFTDGGISPPIGTVWTWNPKKGKYTFEFEGKEYETPANEVEGNTDFFIEAPIETPEVKAKVVQMRPMSVNEEKDLPALIAMMTPHEKTLFASILEEVLKMLK